MRTGEGQTTTPPLGRTTCPPTTASGGGGVQRLRAIVFGSTFLGMCLCAVAWVWILAGQQTFRVLGASPGQTYLSVDNGDCPIKKSRELLQVEITFRLGLEATEAAGHGFNGRNLGSRS